MKKRSIETSPPYAHMIGNRFDVSAYCQQSLIDAIGHLLSVKLALFTLIRPALKIAARSFFLEHQTRPLWNILSHLNSNTPIVSLPSEARLQGSKRSLCKRLIYFLLVGIPLAVLAGISVGIFHFLKAVSNDLMIIFKITTRLYAMSRSDRKFYQANPQLLPSRNLAIDGVIHGAWGFYSRRVIYRKLGILSFVAKPLLKLIESMLINRLIQFFDRIDPIRAQNNSMATSEPLSLALDSSYTCRSIRQRVKLDRF